MVKDFKGNEYENLSQMCEAYNVKLATYSKRISRGYSNKEALTGRKYYVYDHEGNKFLDIKDMARYYNITTTLYYSRKRKGYSIEECLNGRKRPAKYYDHKGKGYPSQKAMAEAYGITLTTFKARQNYGWSLERTLTTPVGKKNNRITEDHLGNTYSSEREKCKAYNINPVTYRRRKKIGMSEKEALTKPIQKNEKWKEKQIQS